MLSRYMLHVTCYMLHVTCYNYQRKVFWQCCIASHLPTDEMNVQWESPSGYGDDSQVLMLRNNALLICQSNQIMHFNCR